MMILKSIALIAAAIIAMLLTGILLIAIWLLLPEARRYYRDALAYATRGIARGWTGRRSISA